METNNDIRDTSPAIRRFQYGVSWGAIFAGCFAALAVYLLLTVLGTAIGASAVDPVGDRNPLSGAGASVGIWFAIATLASIFVGAFISGRSSPRQGVLHGLLTWSVVTVTTTWLLASLVAGVTGAAGNLVGSGLALAGRSVAAVAPSIATGVKQQLRQNGIDFDWSELQGQLNSVLHDSGKTALQPQNLKAKANDAVDDAKHTAETAGQKPQAGGDELAQWFARVKDKAQPALDAADKDALINIVAARTGKSHAESQQIVDNYAKTYDAALAKFAQLKEQAEQQAREAAATAARGLSKAAWGSLVILLLGALVAVFGGWFGRRMQASEEAESPLLN